MDCEVDKAGAIRSGRTRISCQIIIYPTNTYRVEYIRFLHAVCMRLGSAVRTPGDPDTADGASVQYGMCAQAREERDTRNFILVKIRKQAGTKFQASHRKLTWIHTGTSVSASGVTYVWMILLSVSSR